LKTKAVKKKVSRGNISIEILLWENSLVGPIEFCIPVGAEKTGQGKLEGVCNTN